MSNKKLHMPLILIIMLSILPRFLYSSTTTELHKIAENGNVATMLKALSLKNADINAQDFYRRTPLHLAIESKHLPMVKLLLEKNANLTIADTWGNLPLHVAITARELGIIKLLLNNNININAQNLLGHTALYGISESHNPSAILIMQCLLENGANPNIVEGNGHTPLYHILVKQQPYLQTLSESTFFNYALKLIQALVEHGANPTLKTTLITKKIYPKGTLIQPEEPALHALARIAVDPKTARHDIVNTLLDTLLRSKEILPQTQQKVTETLKDALPDLPKEFIKDIIVPYATSGTFDINIVDNNNHTALMIAMQGKNQEFINKLIQAGAS